MLHEFAERLNAILEKAMPVLTPTGLVIGFLLGPKLAGLTPLVTVLFAFITFTGALGMNTKDFVAVVKNPLPLAVFFVSSHIVIPVAIRFLAAAVFPSEPAFITGFVLLFSIPTAVSGFIWTSIHKGNGPLALTLILLDTMLAPIVVPSTVSLLANTSVRIDAAGMCLSLVWMVVVPSILGVAINHASDGKIPRRVVPLAKPLSKLFLLAVIAVNASRVTGSVTAFEPIFVLLAAACLAFSFSGFCAGTLAGKLSRANRGDTVSLMYAVGLRNISAALVLALEFFPPRVALPVLTGIVFQQTLASIAGITLLGKTKKKDSSPK